MTVIYTDQAYESLHEVTEFFDTHQDPGKMRG